MAAGVPSRLLRVDHPRLPARHAGMGVDNVVDPYGGETGDWEMVLALVEASCKGLAVARL